MCFGDIANCTTPNGYDAFDRLIRREVDTDGDGAFDEAEAFVYDGTDLVMIFEVPPAGGAGSSSLTHRFLSDPATDAVFADEDALGEILWYMTDNQGTVRDVLDYDREDVEPGVWTETRTVIDHIEFSAYGEITSETDPSSRPVLVWTGIYRDPLTGMQLHWHRWYDPQTRRWVSNDPIGFIAGDTNLNRYAGNSPATFVDPTGMSGDDGQHGVGASAAASTAGGVYVGSALIPLPMPLESEPPSFTPVIAPSSMAAGYTQQYNYGQQLQVLDENALTPYNVEQQQDLQRILPWIQGNPYARRYLVVILQLARQAYAGRNVFAERTGLGSRLIGTNPDGGTGVCEWFRWRFEEQREKYFGVLAREQLQKLGNANPTAREIELQVAKIINALTAATGIRIEVEQWKVRAGAPINATDHVAILVIIQDPKTGEEIGRFYLDGGEFGADQGNMGGANNIFFQDDVKEAEAAGILIPNR